MINKLSDIIHHIAEHERQHSVSTSRPCYVAEVNKNKVRCCVGKQADGTPMLTPWLPCDDPYGGGRSRSLIEKGQNGFVHMTAGRPELGVFSAGSVGKSYPRPAQDDKIKNGAAFQMGKMFISMEKKGKRNAGASSDDSDLSGGFANSESQQESDNTYYDIWIAEQDDQPPAWQEVAGSASGGSSQSGGSDITGAFSGGQTLTPSTQQPKKIMGLRVSESGYLTGVVFDGDKKSVRFAAHKDGAKIAYKGESGTNFCSVTSDKVAVSAENGDTYVNAKGNTYLNAEGQHFINKPMRLKSKKPSDGIPNDDSK